MESLDHSTGNARFQTREEFLAVLESRAPMDPTAFGRYLLVERIAQGGMAEVFRAVFQGPAGVEKTVALKRILPQLDGAADFTAMFIDEARIASSLTHVNIAQVFE